MLLCVDSYNQQLSCMVKQMRNTVMIHITWVSILGEGLGDHKQKTYDFPGLLLVGPQQVFWGEICPS